MQTATLTIHIIGALLAVYIYRNRWRYFAVMLFISNFAGALFYFLVIFENPYRHEYSQLRSLLQAIMLLAFALGLAKDGDDD